MARQLGSTVDAIVERQEEESLISALSGEIDHAPGKHRRGYGGSRGARAGRERPAGCLDAEAAARQPG